MISEIENAPDGGEEESVWQSPAVVLNKAREITELIRKRQTDSVRYEMEVLAESAFFRVASGVTKDHPMVLKGRAALLEQHPDRLVEFEKVWQEVDGAAADGSLLHALIVGVLTEMAEEFSFRPSSPDTDLRIRQESVWCWYQLVLAGLNSRASVGSKAHEANQGIYPNADDDRARKEWALRRTKAGLDGSRGERLAALDLFRRILSSIEAVPQQIGQDDSLSLLDQMLPPNLAAATRRRLARHTGTPQLTPYQSETIPVLAKAIGTGENLLLSAVTGSGKSLLGQIAPHTWSADGNSATAIDERSSPYRSRHSSATSSKS